MPRGFLVKRYPNQLSTDSSPSHQSVDPTGCLALPLTKRPLICRYSDEDRSDSSSSEQEVASVTSIPSPIAISHSSHSLTSLALSPPLLSYSKQYSKAELPQEVPLALTKSSYSSEGKSPVTPNDDESPSALDLRCPSFIFHFPDRMPASAPSIYQRNITALVNRSDNKANTSLTTSKKRHSTDDRKPLKRHKAIRKLNFDEHKSSPVSGTFIRDSDSEDDFSGHSSCVRRSGDIDPSLNVVIITDEARAEIEKIENKIGDYICALCKDKFDDAFGLAQHRCSRIMHVEYRCPECDKVFNCPANLASHRRWHKPRNTTSNGTDGNKKGKVLVTGTATIQPEVNSTNSNCSVDTNSSASDETRGSAGQDNSGDGKYECDFCRKRFRRSAYLKKHLIALHNIDIENNKPSESVEQNNFAFNALKRKQKMFDFTHSVDNSVNNEKELVGNDLNYRCLICSVVFINEIALEMHNKSVHSNRSLNCKYCQNVFFSEAELTIHMNQIHSNSNSNSNSVRPLIKQEFI